MSYTTEKQPQGKALDIKGFLREALISEIVAINGYSKHIDEISLVEIKELLHHIMEDEKRHYGQFLEALRRYDKEEFEVYVESVDHVEIKDKPLKKTYHENKKLTAYSILNKIRDDIKGEYEAILLYDDLINKIEDKCLVKMIRDITKEEKEHVEELTLALMRLDSDKYGPIEEN
ncbi:ferritin-like domain-containing protein [Clostridium perfringens]|uniref:ferritin-like domain-containing protein n=1 Tax=Clostridium perfringens TaxID=1502 RepID=UPI00246969DF|nr:ferritin-like domain-containing protein [Clostridium perfringens]EJT6665068.1 ferritin-like domain-containing protein [Clostridium perfringens]ELC8466610.1 ferritin-like domain-containing protein [Clostridium perfringens]MDH5075836.1 Rubrerythrin [Clostridium perfringens]